VPFLEVWTAIEQGHADRIQTLANENAVLVVAEPTRATLRTPVGEMSPIAVQAHFARGLLAGSRLREASPVATAGVALALAALAAWVLSATRWWVGLAGAVVLAGAYAAALPMALATTGLVLPVVTPLGATALAALGGLVAGQLASGARIRRLEDENARVRETLVRNESAVESLEEDLDAARAVVARSTGAERDLGRAADLLREQLAEARRQEEATRQRLDTLERELSGLRAADARPSELGDAGQEALRRACEEAGIVTRDPAVLAVFHDLSRAARSPLPILIVGEPGTGKELFARAAHRLSPRAAQPFVAVNMAAIPPELFESELFGHVKGAFTGAVAERWFREDLWFRLKGLVLRLSPLRARPDDVVVLASRIVGEAAAELGRPGVTLSEDAVVALRAHAWPGNVRELQNCLRQAVALADGPVLKREDLRLPEPERRLAIEPGDETGDAAVLACLRRHGFDMQTSARELGWDRSTVTQRLKGLGFRALVDADGDRARAARELAGDPVLARAVELKLREYHEH